MNRREFVKKCFGTAMCMALPNIQIKDENGFLVPEHLMEPLKSLKEAPYILGKGIIHIKHKKDGKWKTLYECSDIKFELEKGSIEINNKDIKSHDVMNITHGRVVDPIEPSFDFTLDSIDTNDLMKKLNIGKDCKLLKDEDGKVKVNNN